MRHYRLLIILTAALSISGCPSSSTRFNVTVPEVTSVNEIGTSRISVLSISAWANYKNHLQPSFVIDEKKAYELAAGDTRFMHENSIDQISALVKFSLADTKKSKLISTESIADDTTTSTSTTTSPGDLSTLSLTNVPSPLINTENIPKVKSSNYSDLGKQNARLRYQMATSLYQEVKLLNRYIKDAAIRQGYTPYVIRLQITSMPKMRNLPYDAYVTLGFFNHEMTRLKADTSECNIKESNASEAIKCEHFKLPVVIPLFATDSIENTASSATLGAIKDIGFAVNALGNTAAGVNLGKISEDIQTALGRDTNSLFTVGRLSDNTVKVRMGALQQISSNFALVPKTETVTLLVMIDSVLAKKDKAIERTLEIHSYSEFTHVIKGNTLGGIPTKLDHSIAMNEFSTLDIEITSETLNAEEVIFDLYTELWNYELSNDWSSFVERLDSWCVANKDNVSPYKWCKKGKFPNTEQLWFDIGYYKNFYKPDLLRVEIPVDKPSQLFGSQSALLSDNKEKTSVELYGGYKLDPDRICSALIFFEKPGKESKISNVFHSRAAATKNDGRTAIFEFPSLSKWNLKSAVENKLVKIQVAIAGPFDSCSKSIALPETMNSKCLNNNFCSNWLIYSEDKKTKVEAGYTISSMNTVISPDKNHNGKIRLSLKPTKKNSAKKVNIDVHGAILEKAMNNSAEIKNNGNSFSVDLSKKLNIDLNLQNVIAGEEIKITSKDEKKKSHSPIIFKIVKR